MTETIFKIVMVSIWIAAVTAGFIAGIIAAILGAAYSLVTGKR